MIKNEKKPKMRPSSNNERNRLKHRMWEIMREVVAWNAVIKPDPLHKRYAVNKFGIYVEGNIDVLRDAHDRFLAMLAVHGYHLNHRHNETLVTQDRNDLVVCVYVPMTTMRDSDEAVIRIGVH